MARCRDALAPEDVRDDGFTEQAAELHAVVQSDAAQPEKACAFLKLVDLDETPALVPLLRPG